jgi:hypothetical protein
MHVAAIGPQVEDGIADDLSGPVVGHVAAAACFVDLDTELRQALGRGQDVRSPAVSFHAERDDGRMLQQQEQIGHTLGPPLLDERALHRERVGVGDDPEPADFKGPHRGGSRLRAGATCGCQAGSPVACPCDFYSGPPAGWSAKLLSKGCRGDYRFS